MTIDPQGLSSAHLIVEYGDYEWLVFQSGLPVDSAGPARRAGRVRVRQFPLTDVTRMRWLPHSPRDCQDLWIKIV